MSTEDLIRGVAAHECGHLLVAHHFRQLCDCSVWKVESPKTQTSLSFQGSCQRRDIYRVLTPFKTACIGWAGAVAEYILEEGESFRDLDLRELLAWLSDGHWPSEPDRINAYGHTQRFRAAKKARDIIFKHREKLIIAGDLAVEQMAKGQSVAWFAPEDIGLTPHRKYILQLEAA